jgi:hypothetical protein
MFVPGTDTECPLPFTNKALNSKRTNAEGDGEPFATKLTTLEFTVPSRNRTLVKVTTTLLQHEVVATMRFCSITSTAVVLPYTLRDTQYTSYIVEGSRGVNRKLCAMRGSEICTNLFNKSTEAALWGGLEGKKAPQCTVPFSDNFIVTRIEELKAEMTRDVMRGAVGKVGAVDGEEVGEDEGEKMEKEEGWEEEKAVGEDDLGDKKGVTLGETL